MISMTEKEAEYFNEILRRVSEKHCPYKGRQVLIIGGVKHRGKEGIVFWHGKDKYSDAGRYGNIYSDAMRIARGVHGYRVGIESDNGEKFFVPAHYVKILL